MGTRSGGLGTSSTSGSKLDVEGVDLKLFASCNDVMGGHHSGVGRRFFSVSLDLHTTGHTDQGFTARQISDVDKSVIESSQNVSNSEDYFSFLKS